MASGNQAHLVRSVLLVHVQDVDPQPVSFLKRPVAQVTREFPVSLIHTASVFQVLVSVIFVGKHFAAPLAFITLPGFCTTQGKAPSFNHVEVSRPPAGAGTRPRTVVAFRNGNSITVNIQGAIIGKNATSNAELWGALLRSPMLPSVTAVWRAHSRWAKSGEMTSCGTDFSGVRISLLVSTTFKRRSPFAWRQAQQRE